MSEDKKPAIQWATQEEALAGTKAVPVALQDALQVVIEASTLSEQMRMRAHASGVIDLPELRHALDLIERLARAVVQLQGRH